MFGKFWRYLLILLIAVGFLFVFLNPFPSTDLYKKRNRPGVVFWHGDPTQKKVALTFDDGPNEPYTSEILDVLKKANVHATFFVLGKNVERYPDTVKRMFQEGHVVGNHSYSHPDMILETDAQVRHQIQEAEQAIEKVTTQKPILFRPPYGLDDPLTFLQTEKLCYDVIKWSVSAEDWRRPGVNQIVDRVTRNTHNGAIILMHDGDKLRHGSDRSQTVAALAILIPALRQQGYELVTVPDLLGLK